MAIKIDKKIVGYSVVKDNTSNKEPPKPEVEPTKPLKRPHVLEGSTYKLQNHAQNYNLYMTVNYHEDEPFEIFLDSSHTDSAQWVKALSRLMSAMLRSPDPNLNIQFLSKELIKVHSDQGYHAGGKGGFVAGIVQHIGKTLAYIDKTRQKPSQSLTEPVAQESEPVVESDTHSRRDSPCPECGDNMVLMDGCHQCTTCGYSKCN